MATTAQGTNLVIWMIVFNFLVILSFVCRFAARHIQGRKWRLDDFLVIFAFFCLLGLEIPSWMSYDQNLGAHVWELTPEQAVWQLKVQYSSGITWTLATVSCKVAVLWMYLSLFPLGRTRIAVYIVMGCSVAYAIAFIPIFMTSCLPVTAVWSTDPQVHLEKCHPIQNQEFASVSVNMALDLAVVFIPLPVIWSLQLPVSKKVFISLMFSLGLAIVGVMAWRIQTTVASTKTEDWSYILVKVALQSHLELWLGIIAANLPTTRPVFAQAIWPAVKSLTSRSSLSSSQGSGSSHGSSGATHRNYGRFEEAKVSGEDSLIATDSFHFHPSAKGSISSQV